jgi:hypothetical protein
MMDEGWGVKLEDRGVGFRFRVLGFGFQVPGSIVPGAMSQFRVLGAKRLLIEEVPSIGDSGYRVPT